MREYSMRDIYNITGLTYETVYKVMAMCGVKPRKAKDGPRVLQFVDESGLKIIIQATLPVCRQNCQQSMYGRCVALKGCRQPCAFYKAVTA